MQLIRLSFNNIHTPMMCDDDGTLWCTSPAVCRALQIHKSTLSELYRTHSDEFDCLRVSNSDSKKFLDQHRVEFGIRRLRKDMRLWSEDDLIVIAMLSRSPVSKEFRQELKKFVKANAVREVLKDYVTKEQYNELVERMASFEQLMSEGQPALSQSAAAAGSALNAHKKLRHLRRVE